MAKRPSNKEKPQRQSPSVQSKSSSKESSRRSRSDDDDDDEEEEEEEREEESAEDESPAESAPSASSPKRMKITWKVYDTTNYKEVATFAYPKKSDADDLAAKRSKDTGRTYVVRPVRVPVDDEKKSTKS